MFFNNFGRIVAVLSSFTGSLDQNRATFYKVRPMLRMDTSSVFYDRDKSDIVRYRRFSALYFDVGKLK